MRLRKFIGMFLMSSSLSAGDVFADVAPGHELALNYPHDVEASPSTVTLLPAPSSVIKSDKLLSSAYYDTLSILREENHCSEFFGGPKFSVEVFNQFAARLSKDYLPKGIGMRMSGTLTDVFDAESQNRYRLFEKIAVNQDGPFYQRRFVNSGASMPNIGSFHPGTKEARVLIFLHELGHLIKDREGEWLLPNDGRDERLSQENSRKIERACGEQIQQLNKSARLESEAKPKVSKQTIDPLPQFQAPEFERV